MKIIEVPTGDTPGEGEFVAAIRVNGEKGVALARALLPETPFVFRDSRRADAEFTYSVSGDEPIQGGRWALDGGAPLVEISAVRPDALQLSKLSGEDRAKVREMAGRFTQERQELLQLRCGRLAAAMLVVWEASRSEQGGLLPAVGRELKDLGWAKEDADRFIALLSELGGVDPGEPDEHVLGDLLGPEQVRTFRLWLGAQPEREWELPEQVVFSSYALPKISVGGCNTAQEMVDMEAALAAYPCHLLYQSHGSLMRVVRGSGGLALDRADLMNMPKIASKVAAWGRELERKGKMVFAPARPPQQTMKAFFADGTWSKEHIPECLGLTSVPVLRPDGTVLDQEGYDPISKLFYAPGADFPKIPARPTREDALEAVDKFVDLLRDFPFRKREEDQEPYSLGAAVALILSPFARYAITNGNTPMIAVSAHTPGSGKTLLVDVANVILTGKSAPRFSLPKSKAEEAKQLFAIAVAGAPLVLFDNVEARIGSPNLNAYLTGETYAGRVLGETRTAHASARGILVATGNNLKVKKDMDRRVMLIEIDPEEARPEKRTGFKYADLIGEVSRRREELVAAALTILRAFSVERPEVAIKDGLGASFGDWENLVRKAVIWLGLPDPMAGKQILEAEGDPELDAFYRLYEEWYAHFGDEPTTTKAAVDYAWADGGDDALRHDREDLRDGLLGVLYGSRKDQKASATRVSQRLGTKAGRKLPSPECPEEGYVVGKGLKQSRGGYEWIVRKWPA